MISKLIKYDRMSNAEMLQLRKVIDNYLQLTHAHLKLRPRLNLQQDLRKVRILNYERTEEF